MEILLAESFLYIILLFALCMTAKVSRKTFLIALTIGISIFIGQISLYSNWSGNFPIPEHWIIAIINIIYIVLLVLVLKSKKERE